MQGKETFFPGKICDQEEKISKSLVERPYFQLNCSGDHWRGSLGTGQRFHYRSYTFNLKSNTRPRKHRYLSYSADKGTKLALSNLACPQGSSRLCERQGASRRFVESRKPAASASPLTGLENGRRSTTLAVAIAVRKSGIPRSWTFKSGTKTVRKFSCLRKSTNLKS